MSQVTQRSDIPSSWISLCELRFYFILFYFILIIAELSNSIFLRHRRKLLVYNPGDRYSPTQGLAHPYITFSGTGTEGADGASASAGGASATGGSGNSLATAAPPAAAASTATKQDTATTVVASLPSQEVSTRDVSTRDVSVSTRDVRLFPTREREEREVRSLPTRSFPSTSLLNSSTTAATNVAATSGKRQNLFPDTDRNTRQEVDRGVVNSEAAAAGAGGGVLQRKAGGEDILPVRTGEDLNRGRTR